MSIASTWSGATSAQKWSAGMQLGGGILQGIGAYYQGQATSAQLTFNARQSSIDAQIAVQNADLEAKLLREQGRALTGKQRTATAISGIRLQGTPLEVMADSIENIELDAIRIRQEGRFREAQLLAQAEWQEEMADYQEDMGTLGLISGVIGGASSAAGVFAG